MAKFEDQRVKINLIDRITKIKTCHGGHILDVTFINNILMYKGHFIVSTVHLI